MGRFCLLLLFQEIVRGFAVLAISSASITNLKISGFNISFFISLHFKCFGIIFSSFIEFKQSIKHLATSNCGQIVLNVHKHACGYLPCFPCNIPILVRTVNLFIYYYNALFSSSRILIASALVASANCSSLNSSFHLSDLYAHIRLLDAFIIPPQSFFIKAKRDIFCFSALCTISWY